MLNRLKLAQSRDPGISRDWLFPIPGSRDYELTPGLTSLVLTDEASRSAVNVSRNVPQNEESGHAAAVEQQMRP